MKILTQIVYAFAALVFASACLAGSPIGGESHSAWTDETGGLYAFLSTPEGKDAFALMPASVKKELWLVHLRRAMAELAELNSDQRAVILQAIGLVASGVFEIERSSPNWARDVAEPLRDLETRAREAFDVRVARAVFADLGSEVDFASTETFWETCQCSTESNWCDFITNPGPYCRSGGEFRCRPIASGCGFLLMYACDGLCAD